jgi:hypothetical protein
MPLLPNQNASASKQSFEDIFTTGSFLARWGPPLTVATHFVWSPSRGRLPLLWLSWSPACARSGSLPAAALVMHARLLQKHLPAWVGRERAFLACGQFSLAASLHACNDAQI